MKMLEHQYDKRILESCVDPNPLMVERQDPDNFTRFQAQERCALEIAAYVFERFSSYRVDTVFLMDKVPRKIAQKSIKGRVTILALCTSSHAD